MFWAQHMLGFGWGSWLVGGLMMLLFWGAIIALFVLAFRAFSGAKNRPTNQQTGGREDPLEILKLRYARGEISKDEYDAIHRDLTT